MATVNITVKPRWLFISDKNQWDVRYIMLKSDYDMIYLVLIHYVAEICKRSSEVGGGESRWGNLRRRRPAIIDNSRPWGLVLSAILDPDREHFVFEKKIFFPLAKFKQNQTNAIKNVWNQYINSK